MRVGQMEGAALLDGGTGLGEAGRWSILAARPWRTIEASDRREASLTFPGATPSISPMEGLCPGLGAELAAMAASRPREMVEEDGRVPPFLGGVIGFFGYDLAPRLERLPRKAPRDSRLPDLRLSWYDTFVAIDHRSAEATLWAVDLRRQGPEALEERARSWRRELESPPVRLPRSRITAGPSSNVEPSAYRKAIRRTIEYIHAGDIFQANISQRFEAIGEPEPLDLYLRLRRRSPAPYAAYLALEDGRAVVSSSPELFVEVIGDRVETRPIKGTRPRGATSEEDEAMLAALIASEKDRAELAMIVDLERNDLGRFCSYGTVRVTEPSRIERFQTVYHQVATVEGRLPRPATPATVPMELIPRMFPGGSITGAPKIRAMEIIDELEPNRRSLYTGSIGYLSACGRSAFNIAIRTMLVEGNRVTYQVGGGIVADSDPQLEFEETLHKGRAMREVLEGSA
ncbi:aminodeoxychorismate synthase component I [Tautonia sociabilis]|uniref:aminodeoxychorismate synthase n=2 Tax=Tautonia sociabilis TaxID=2080755 RepID=A0A432MFS7_9BACT|nr:aminodeoxychorismate synthase component I [Tautonia sociabilis]